MEFDFSEEYIDYTWCSGLDYTWCSALGSSLFLKYQTPFIWLPISCKKLHRLNGVDFAFLKRGCLLIRGLGVKRLLQDTPKLAMGHPIEWQK